LVEDRLEGAWGGERAVGAVTLNRWYGGVDL
jgi:hypothetical protein